MYMVIIIQMICLCIFWFLLLLKIIYQYTTKVNFQYKHIQVIRKIEKPDELGQLTTQRIAFSSIPPKDFTDTLMIELDS